MIFISANTEGVKKIDWIKSLPVGAHFVTRRILKPKTLARLQRRVQDHSLEALCPGRGKKAVSHAQVNSVTPHEEWMLKATCDRREIPLEPETQAIIYDTEALREGFTSWASVEAWLAAHNVDITKTHRIEFIKAD